MRWERDGGKKIKKGKRGGGVQRLREVAVYHIFEKEEETLKFKSCSKVVHSHLEFRTRQIRTIWVGRSGHQPKASVSDKFGMRPNNQLSYRLDL